MLAPWVRRAITERSRLNALDNTGPGAIGDARDKTDRAVGASMSQPPNGARTSLLDMRGGAASAPTTLDCGCPTTELCQGCLRCEACRGCECSFYQDGPAYFDDLEDQ